MAVLRRPDGFWASVLQWSRLGTNALVFLFVARFLTLEQIGAFATAAAPLRFFQVIHKSGIEETVVIRPTGDSWRDALSVLSILAGAAVVAICLGVAGLVNWLMADQSSIGPMLAVLSLTSLAHGVSAVPDGMLRRDGHFRTLALRTLAAQAVATVATFGALVAGAGAWSLVVFTLVNAILSAVIAIHAASWRLPRRWPARIILHDALQSVTGLSGRVLIGAVLQPVLQIGIGAIGGLAAAGAFQIALRVLALMEAVTLAPLRLLALPRFSHLGGTAMLGPAILSMLRMAGLLAAWVYLGVAAAAPDILAVMVGGSNAGDTVLSLRILCLTGLSVATATVINQALIGASLGSAAVRLAVWNAVLSLLLAAPVLIGAAFIPGLAPHVGAGVAASVVVVGLIVLARMLGALPGWFGTSGSRALAAVGLPFVAGGIMAVAVAGAGRWLWADWPVVLRLTCQVAGGSLLYLVLVRIGCGPAAPSLLRAVAR